MPKLLEVKAGGSRQGQLRVAPNGGRYLPDVSERGASRSLLGHKPGEEQGRRWKRRQSRNATTCTLITYLRQSSPQPMRG